MSTLAYTLDPEPTDAPPIGLIVLQSDETIEPEFRRHFADDPSPIYVSRIRSAPVVSRQSLAGMEADLAAAASLLPEAVDFPVVAYCCTSASSVIGSDRVADLVRAGCRARTVTNPLRAAAACCADRGISRLALVSPYVETVNAPLRRAFAGLGVEMDVFGTFAEPNEHNVARISWASVEAAALALGKDRSVDGVFLSCTNLRTMDRIANLEARLGKPVLSSNQSLAWHLRALKGKNGRAERSTE